MAAAKYTLRSLACRYLRLDKEIRGLQGEMESLTRMEGPSLGSVDIHFQRHINLNLN